MVIPQTNSHRITFVLPHATNVPIGGYKVVYEFANELVKRGHKVSVVLPKLMHARTGVVGEVRNLLWPHLHRRRNPGVVTWFRLDSRVQLILCADLRERWLPPADFIVATSWRTAPFVAGYSARLGRKLYLIQHLETFGGPYEDVVGTWKLPFQKLVISKWLADFAQSIGEECSLIRLGVDFDDYGLDNPIAGRGHSVAMLYHDTYVKASWDGINAIELAKERAPDLKATVFGVPDRPDGLPKWIEYVQRASAAQLRVIYNQAAVFVHSSWSEGWPMPPAEAMACGAAIVASGNPGILDYLKPGLTGVVSRPKYWTELADNLVSLLADEALRTTIAEAGHQDILQYTWERATDRFLQVISPPGT